MEPIPEHPAIGAGRQIVEMYGRKAYCAPVTCSVCDAVRWCPTATLRQQLQRANYTGKCRSCSTELARAGLQRAAQRCGTSARRVKSNGYVEIGRYGVLDDDMPLYRSMLSRTKANSLMEHRWVIAKHLGRPLESWECVDHQDGDKTNNELGNLRLYVRGKQQPGSCPGYGTYYHEWQMAERRIRELENA